MEITKEQIKEIKENLFSQINSTFPEDQKSSAIEQINSMQDQEFIEFLKQNNLLKTPDSQEKCIFCSIAKKQIPSSILEEDENYIAVLEINPISPGHTIIVPKNHTNSFPETFPKITQEIEKKIKLNLKPKNIITSPSSMFNHEIINLIPVYDNENENSKRKKASKEELEEIKKQILKVQQEQIKEPKQIKQKKITSKNTWLPKRIP